MNEIAIDTNRKVLNKVQGNGTLEFYLGSELGVKNIRLYSADVTADKNMKLEKGNKINERVGWKRSKLESDRILYVSGERFSYLLRTVANIYMGF